jgi:E3 ubiquitin-protein ligase MARCH6
MGPGSRISTTLYAITRNGILKPDVRLASRAFVLPVTVVCLALLGGPLVSAKAIIMIVGIQDQEVKMHLYRFAYPSALGLLVTWLGMLGVKKQVASWRAKIRDEVYLIGERLHNFSEPKPDKVVKGKAKVKDL